MSWVGLSRLALPLIRRISVRFDLQQSSKLNSLHDRTTAGQRAAAAPADVVRRRLAADSGAGRLAPAEGRTLTGTSQRQRRVHRVARLGVLVGDRPAGARRGGPGSRTLQWAA